MSTANLIVRQHQFDGEGTYPFTDDSTFLTVSGVTVPKFMFIDAILYPVGSSADLFVSKITTNESGLTVEVSNATGLMCSGTIAFNTSEHIIKLFDTYNRPSGIIVGNKDDGKFYGGLLQGEHTLEAGSLQFVSTCVAPQPQSNVNGILLEDNSLMSGDVWLVGKDGVFLEWNEATACIIVHVAGDPLFRKRNCETGGTEFTAPTPLRSLQFITNTGTADINPDQYGGVRITPGSNQNAKNVLRVEAIENGLRLKAIGSIT